MLAVFVVCGLALAAGLIGGRFRFRWSWTDALVIGLMTLVARSAWHAVDRRPAINMAWEWIALGLAYLLVRNLPRTRNESSTLAGVLVATAFAVSCYGLYQNGVELPMLQAAFQRNPQQFLRALDIEPGSRGEEMLRNRLLFSNELFSTFALPNSLAGFIVGPLALALAVSLQSLVRRDTPGSRWSALAMAAPVILVLLVSLILTKSRSAWVGLLVAMIYWAWHARRHLSVRALVASGIGATRVGHGTGAGGARHRPTRSRGGDAIDDVAALSLGVLARCLGGDLGRGYQPDEHSRVADPLVGSGAGQLWRSLPQIQAAGSERGDPGPAQPVLRSLVNGRRLGSRRPDRRVGMGAMEYFWPVRA